MLNRLAPAAHGLGILIQSLLHSFENVLMRPSRDAAFFACGALILDCAGLAGVRPVAAHLLSNASEMKSSAPATLNFYSQGHDFNSGRRDTSFKLATTTRRFISPF